MEHAGGVLTQQLEDYFDRLWPICRSITGEGLRESFRILQEIIPLELHEVPTGTQVFDWEIPQEWNIRDAYIETPDGRRVAEFSENNLHVVNYSIPFTGKMSKAELATHIHTLPKQPNAIPYVTSYYKDNWGFCMTHNEWESLPEEGEYTVVVDSEKKEGSLTYGTCVLPGNTEEEILFSSYLCHPSMANNELSGPLALAFLYQKLAQQENRRYTYRFVLAPETIGVIAFLAKYGEGLKKNLHAGYVLTCCADPGPITYQRSKKGATAADEMAEHLLKYHHPNHKVRNFRVGGSDERQYGSPGFQLPVGTLMRTPYKLYDEYHTSLDNKEFISFKALEEFINLLGDVCTGLEINQIYKGVVQYCEPMLGKRGLYDSEGSWMKDNTFRNRLLHFLSFADGDTSVLETAERREDSILDFAEVIRVAQQNSLIKPVD